MPGEHLEVVDLAQVDQMPAPRYVGRGVSAKLIHLFAKLRCDEAADGLWNDLTRRQQSARISESTKLKSEAEAIACMATGWGHCIKVTLSSGSCELYGNIRGFSRVSDL